MFFNKFLLLATSSIYIYSETEKDEKTSKYKYKTIKGDIYNSRYIELDNGLKIYLVPQKDKPTADVRFIFNVGSKHDPKDNTGLAHYLEHIVCSSGTSKIGTLDYDKEKHLLEKIEDLFEKYRVEKDKKKRENIYKEIDSYSLKASKFSTCNELFSILQSLGGSELNAYTTKDNTTYFYKIPINNLEKSLKIFSEALFNNTVRRFSNELQIIYEEYIRGNENSSSVCFNKVMEQLCDNHPYKVPIIGYPEHLRKPSIKSLKEFYKTYYVPNNCTILIVGDIDFDKTVDYIEKYFGKYKKKEIPKKEFNEIKLPDKKKEINVITEDYNYCALIFPYKNNDIKFKFKINFLTYFLGTYLKKLYEEQKIDYVYCDNYEFNDIGALSVIIRPLDRQSLKVAKDIVLNKIKEFCSGKDNIRSYNYVKNSNIYNSRNDENRYYIINIFDQLISSFNFEDIANSEILSNKLIETISKDECEKLMNDFINKPYFDLNKNSGNRNFDKIEILKCSDMFLNKDKKSDYFKKIENLKTTNIEPFDIDYKTMINKYTYNTNVDFFYTKPNNKKIFKCEIRYYYGSIHDKYIKILHHFINFSNSKGTTFNSLCDKIRELGSYVNAFFEQEYVSILLFGIEENLDKTLNIFSDYVNNINFDDNCIKNGVKSYINYAYDFKLDKIMYQDYKNYIVNEIEVKLLDKNKLKNIFNNILSSKSEVIFTSSIEPNNFIEKLIKTKLFDKCKNKHINKMIKFKDYKKNKIFINNSKKAQNVVCKIYNIIDKMKYEDKALLDFYNTYYSNIYYNCIRDKNGLTYSNNWMIYFNDNIIDKDYLEVKFDTQPDKFKRAFSETLKLYNFTKDEKQYNLTKKQINSMYNCIRYNDIRLLNKYLDDKRFNIDVKNTNGLYIYGKNLHSLTFDKIINLHNTKIKDSPKIIYITANLEDLDIEFLSKYGEVKIIK